MHEKVMEGPLTMVYDDLEVLLRPLLQQHLQANIMETGDAAAVEQHAHDTRVGAALDNLQNLIENHARSSQGMEDVQGVAMPEVDEQLGPLQQEVDDVLQRLAGPSGLRNSVPALMAATLEQQLKALRPAADTAEISDQPSADADNDQQLETAKQLHHAMKGALNKLPSLRARLEEMELRLGRNLAAFDTAQARAAQPPPTVERILRGVAVGRGMAAACGHE